MSENTLVLVGRARKQLNVHTNTDLAEFLGVSRRTVQRHLKQGGIPDTSSLDRLLTALHPRDPGLTQDLANAFGRDLAALGLSAAPAKTEEAPSPEHAEAVILAASDALGMLPRDVRPALATIFRRVRSLGVDLDRLTALLAEADAQPKP